MKKILFVHLLALVALWFLGDYCQDYYATLSTSYQELGWENYQGVPLTRPRTIFAVIAIFTMLFSLLVGEFIKQKNTIAGFLVQLFAFAFLCYGIAMAGVSKMLFNATISLRDSVEFWHFYIIITAAISSYFILIDLKNLGKKVYFFYLLNAAAYTFLLVFFYYYLTEESNSTMAGGRLFTAEERDLGFDVVSKIHLGSAYFKVFVIVAVLSVVLGRKSIGIPQQRPFTILAWVSFSVGVFFYILSEELFIEATQIPVFLICLIQIMYSLHIYKESKPTISVGRSDILDDFHS